MKKLKLMMVTLVMCLVGNVDENINSEITKSDKIKEDVEKLSLSLEVEVIKDENRFNSDKIVEYTDSTYHFKVESPISDFHGIFYISHGKYVSDLNLSLDDMMRKLKKAKCIITDESLEYQDDDISLFMGSLTIEDYNVGSPGIWGRNLSNEGLLQYISFIEDNIRQIEPEFITVTDRTGSKVKSYKKKINPY